MVAYFTWTVKGNGKFNRFLRIGCCTFVANILSQFFQINSCLYYAQKVILLAIQRIGVCILIIKPITRFVYRKAKNDCTADYRT